MFKFLDRIWSAKKGVVRGQGKFFRRGKEKVRQFEKKGNLLLGVG